MKSRNKTKMAPHKLVSLATIIALTTLVTLVIANSNTFDIMAIMPLCHYAIMPFWPPCCESEANLSKKSFVPVTGLKCSSPSYLGGRDNSGGRVVSSRQVG